MNDYPGGLTSTPIVTLLTKLVDKEEMGAVMAMCSGMREGMMEDGSCFRADCSNKIKCNPEPLIIIILGPNKHAMLQECSVLKCSSVQLFSHRCATKG